jgi:DNA-binding NarL/FixJ family response regulator
MSLRILLADDHSIVREGLRLVLEREGFQVVGEAADGHEAIHLAEAHKPDVAVLDLSMPSLNGLEAGRQIVQRSNRRQAVIILTMYKEEHQIIAALRAGIRGYLVKTQAASDLPRAIREVASGGIYMSPGVYGLVVDAYLSGTEPVADPLTSREREVLQLVAEGKTTKEAAIVLGISAKTAECHRVRLMDKLNIHETAGLVRYAIRQGVIEA